MQTDMSQNPQNAGSPASDSNDQDQSLAPSLTHISEPTRPY